jgi:hypothetical protein
MQRLNIICGRSERLNRLHSELSAHGIENFKLWEGVHTHSIKQSINLAHKQIVEYAKLSEFSEVIIAEDDIKFSAPGAWKYFLDKKPDDYDLYLGGIFLGQPSENGIVSEFTGLTLYSIHSRFYDKFLSLPDDDHIDRLLSGMGRFIVCQPFVATQYDGISSNTGKFESYGYLQRDRDFFGL